MWSSKVSPYKTFTEDTIFILKDTIWSNQIQAATVFDSFLYK